MRPRPSADPLGSPRYRAPARCVGCRCAEALVTVFKHKRRRRSRVVLIAVNDQASTWMIEVPHDLSRPKRAYYCIDLSQDN